MNTVNYMQGAISAWTLLVSYHIIMCIMKFIFILGSFFKRGHCWQFWCFTHTDCRKCAKHGVCSVMDLCQAYSTSPVYYHRVYIQHEQDKLFMCQLPDNVWIKILYILILQRSKLKLWLIFKHFFLWIESKHSVSRWIWSMEHLRPPSTPNSFSHSCLDNFQVQ